jgi:hypothetical protein
MAAHLQEAAIVEAILADEDGLDRGLHVVVDAAAAGALEQGERPVVGVEHHLLRLPRIGTHEQHAAVAEPDMGDMIGSGPNAEAAGSVPGTVIACADAAVTVNAANVTARKILTTTPPKRLYPTIHITLAVRSYRCERRDNLQRPLLAPSDGEKAWSRSSRMMMHRT